MGVMLRHMHLLAVIPLLLSSAGATNGGYRGRCLGTPQKFGHQLLSHFVPDVQFRKLGRFFKWLVSFATLFS